MAVNEYMSAASISNVTGQYVDSLDAAVELMLMRENKVVKELDEIFHPIPAEGATLKMSDVGSMLDLPKQNEDEDDLPFSTPAPGRNTTFTPVQYRQAVAITQGFMEDDRFGKGRAMASGLVPAVDQKKQYLMNVLLTNAFTSGTGNDGAYLIADSHDSVNPRGSARDNLGTGALSLDNYHALRLLADQQVNELGYPAPGKIDVMIVPPALWRTAEEIRVAKKDPETQLNTDMVGVNYRILENHYASSSTAYFGINKAKAGLQSGMYCVYIAMGPDLKDCKPTNPDVIWAMRSRFRLTYGFSCAVEYIYGSTGS
jgi:hypothetical protein